MSYEAIVTRVKTRPHPNAQKIQLATAHAHQVVVGLDTQDGELGVFFPADGQLSEEFILANNLYSESTRLKLGLTNLGITSFGFFSDKRRVRAQSFRGERSDGFWCPMNYLSYLGPVDLREGDVFNEIAGYEVCRKYFTPATIHAQGKVGKRQKENKCFPKHDVTLKFKYVAESIPLDAAFYITEKLHGTSGRYGLVLDDIKVPFYARWWNSLAVTCNIHFGTELPIFQEQEYVYLNGSKNVILEKSLGPGYYGTNEFRYKAIEGVELHKGEVLYFEIVGWVGDRPIMDTHPIKDEVKHLRALYGDIMTYKYSQPIGTADIYVYKIARMNEDGLGIELSWPQLTARCHELGLKTVPLLTSMMLNHIPDDRDKSAKLSSEVDTFTEGPSTLDPSHMREGVVLRVESPEGTSYIKNKSWNFGVLEGYIKDSDTYVDVEEAEESSKIEVQNDQIS